MKHFLIRGHATFHSHPWAQTKGVGVGEGLCVCVCVWMNGLLRDWMRSEALSLFFAAIWKALQVARFQFFHLKLPDKKETITSISILNKYEWFQSNWYDILPYHCTLTNLIRIYIYIFVRGKSDNLATPAYSPCEIKAI